MLSTAQRAWALSDLFSHPVCPNVHLAIAWYLSGMVVAEHSRVQMASCMQARQVEHQQLTCNAARRRLLRHRHRVAGLDHIRRAARRDAGQLDDAQHLS